MISGLLHNIFISKRIKKQTLNITQTEGAYICWSIKFTLIYDPDFHGCLSLVCCRKKRKKKKRKRKININSFFPSATQFNHFHCYIILRFYFIFIFFIVLSTNSTCPDWAGNNAMAVCSSRWVITYQNWSRRLMTKLQLQPLYIFFESIALHNQALKQNFIIFKNKKT